MLLFFCPFRCRGCLVRDISEDTLSVDTLPDTRGDHYIELMRDSRGLAVSRNELRELWYNGLEHPNKEEIVFELEMLLKGVVCFGKLDNHPGQKKREPKESRQFFDELRVLQTAFERITELSEQLIIPEEERSSSDIYLTSGPLEHVTTPLIEEPFEQETPDHSLRLIHRAFGNLTDVVSVMMKLERIPHRGFIGVAELAGREIGRNVFFNPLVSLEFRPEYDHLQHIEILHIVYGGGPDGAQRAATLSFLSLFRLLRYLQYAELYLQDSNSSQLVFIPLAVARSDGQALSKFIRKEARHWLSGGFEREVMTLSAKEIIEAAPGLTKDYHLLHELRAMLRSTGDQLYLELRRMYEQKLTLVPELLHSSNFQKITTTAIAELRDFLMQTVLRIAQVFKPDLDGRSVFEDFLDETKQADRLRRDMWMFSQILRGFLAKAAAAPETTNRWTGQSSYRFVREFISYFRNLGYHLLRTSNYDRFEEFMTQLEGLSAAEVIDESSVEVFVAECEAFREYLLDSFKNLGKTERLVNITFDRHDAAETLRLYLDRG